MSIRATLWARDVCALLDAPADCRLFMLALALRHHDKTGECFPSYETISDDTGIPRRRIITVAKECAYNGIVIIQPRRVRGHQGSNQFVLFGRPAFSKWSKSRVRKKALWQSADGGTLARVRTGAPDREELTTKGAVPEPWQPSVIAGGRHAG